MIGLQTIRPPQCADVGPCPRSPQVASVIVLSTQYGVPVRAFDTPEAAHEWLAERRDEYPGWKLEAVTQRISEIRITLETDEAQERAA